MNRLSKLALLLLLALQITGCNTMQGSSSEKTTAPVLSRIEQRGELILGTSANMPPMTYTKDGQVVGFDIDMARLMADVMDVRLTIKTLRFADLLPALQRGDVDVVISNLTITPERNKKVAFVGPYLTSGKCLVSKNENLARAAEAEELNRPETRIAVLKGSTSERFVRTLLPKATVTTTEDIASGVQLVIDDQVGALLSEYPICLSTLQSHPDAGFVSVLSLLSYEPIGIALPDNDPLFVNWTENFLTRMDGTNSLEALSRKWFGKFEISVDQAAQ